MVENRGERIFRRLDVGTKKALYPTYINSGDIRFISTRSEVATRHMLDIKNFLAELIAAPLLVSIRKILFGIVEQYSWLPSEAVTTDSFPLLKC